tara:strand:- start:347 stop:526 length:180 start_codon:yes stop_codon:yes gene_type:complete
MVQIYLHIRIQNKALFFLPIANHIKSKPSKIENNKSSKKEIAQRSFGQNGLDVHGRTQP